MADLERAERLQIMLNGEELKAVDDFRFQKRMPSRAAAVRELMRRGLSAEGFSVATTGEKSTSFGVLPTKAAEAPGSDGAQRHGNGHAGRSEGSPIRSLAGDYWPPIDAHSAASSGRSIAPRKATARSLFRVQ